MTESLEIALQELGQLPKAEQDRLARVLHDYVEQFADNARHDEDMNDPAYRAEVVQALQEGEADIAAGRVHPAGEVFAGLKSSFKEKHGL